jgi:type II secretory pathway pseudopilin PulG
VIAIIAILAAILFPVFAQAKAAAKQTADLSNIKQASLACLMYANDYDDTLASLDNNGACLYSDNPCAMPDWGDATNDNRDRNARPMFLNVVQPYAKSDDIMYSPAPGKTDWKAAVAAGLGIIWGGAYDKSREDVYYGICGMYAVNINLVRWHPPTGNQSGQIGTYSWKLSAINRPAEVMMLANSVWDDDKSIDLAVGNTGVWPQNRANGNRCADGTQEGWTWYLHRNKGGQRGNRARRENGIANVGFSDGHSRNARYPILEACNYDANVNLWYHTYWDPRY